MIKFLIYVNDQLSYLITYMISVFRKEAFLKPLLIDEIFCIVLDVYYTVGR